MTLHDKHHFASVDHLSAEAVAAYVDNELTPRALHRAKVHLLKCDECRYEIKAHLAASRRLREAAAHNTVSTPADLKARLASIPVECAFDTDPDDSAHASAHDDPTGGVHDRTSEPADDENSWASRSGRSRRSGRTASSVKAAAVHALRHFEQSGRRHHGTSRDNSSSQ